MTTIPGLPEPRFVDTNGIRMAVFEQGAGVPVVMCHGFPELAYSWRHQITALADRGFRAIAPDQRGYGLTDCPGAVEDFDIHHLTGDLVGMLDALDIDKAIFCGHDWGGIITWQMPLLHPDRVLGLIGVNTPFIPRTPMPPIDMFRTMFGPDHYIVFFQTPGVADAGLAKDTRRTFEKLMRKNIKMAEFRAQASREGGRGINIIDMIDGPDFPGAPLLSDDELDVFVSTFERTGFTGGINWYRNFNRNWELIEGIEQKVSQPSLMITAENDPFLPPAMAAVNKTYVKDLETHMIANCGHWTQQEHPDELNRLLIDWLTRRFG